MKNYVDIPNEMIGKNLKVKVKRNGKGIVEEVGIFKGYNGSYAHFDYNGRDWDASFSKIKEWEEIK